MAVRMHKILPYVIVLAIVSYLYFLAAKIDFVAPGGRIGPDFWPKVILALTMVTCAYEIVKNLFFGKADRDLEGVLASVLKDAPQEFPSSAAEEKTYPYLLWIGIAITVAYAVLIEKLGFFLCTLIYLAAFMWIGRYRRFGVILITSLIGSLAFMFMFMKVVYVSLPLGVEPFSQVSFLLMRLMGIK
jgi:putative tricarboxylic transport membrane protein